jgi:hypothetical protein
MIGSDGSFKERLEISEYLAVPFVVLASGEQECADRPHRLKLPFPMLKPLRMLHPSPL